MRSPWLPCSFALALFLPLSGCGGVGEVGETCERPASADECVEGAICATDPSGSGGAGTDPTWESYTCRAVCTDQSDCAVGEECRGVTGAFATRACQPVRD